jgi:hypothetical protein
MDTRGTTPEACRAHGRDEARPGNSYPIAKNVLDELEALDDLVDLGRVVLVAPAVLEK